MEEESLKGSGSAAAGLRWTVRDLKKAVDEHSGSQIV
jgi:hypothetical protein